MDGGGESYEMWMVAGIKGGQPKENARFVVLTAIGSGARDATKGKAV